jgi:hypothetical protein
MTLCDVMAAIATPLLLAGDDGSARAVALQAALASEVAQRGRYGAGVGTVTGLLHAPGLEVS